MKRRDALNVLSKAMLETADKLCVRADINSPEDLLTISRLYEKSRVMQSMSGYSMNSQAWWDENIS